METKNLQDLEIKVTFRSSDADISFLSDLAKVIVTSLQEQKKLDVAIIESEATVKSSSEKKLRIFSALISL